MIHTDLYHRRAGPVALFCSFLEAGLLKMRCHLIDTLPQELAVSSQAPSQKPIYDIPGYPEVRKHRILWRESDGASWPFKPTFTLGEQWIIWTSKDGSFIVTTSDKTHVHAQVIIVRVWTVFWAEKIVLENLEVWGKENHLYGKRPQTFHWQK
jgi:thioredoxin reductase (NADPH)